jgi:hypothetical protein
MTSQLQDIKRIKMYLAISALCSYFLWAYIHQISHVIAAHFCVGVKTTTISSRLGVYQPKKTPTPKQKAIIALAPRFLNWVALMLLPLSHHNLYCALFLSGGVADLIIHSFYCGPCGDIKIYSEYLNIPYKRVRNIQLGFATLSVFAFLLGLLETYQRG